MKTISNLLAILFFAFAVSCKNEPSDKNADVEQNPMNEELTKTTNYEESGNFKDEEYILDANKDSLNVNWDLDNPERQQNLYKTFRMNEIQIQQYEKALEDWWKSDDDSPYDKLSANERIKKEDDILKDILNDSQYKKYREWANENDKRGI